MSGVGFLQWAGSQVGPIIGWPFPQFLLHLYPSADLVGKTNCWWKVLWLSWCSNSSVGSCTWLQEMVSSGSIFSISGSLRITLIDSRKLPVDYFSILIPKHPIILVTSHCTGLPLTLQSQSTHRIYSNSLSRKIHSSLG